MNPDSELFKKLVKDAGIQLVHWDDSPRLYIENMTYDVNLAKFAELIVAECINIVKPTQHHEVWAQSYLGGVDGLELLNSKITNIKQHFGVEL
jgi:hypothetical protein